MEKTEFLLLVDKYLIGDATPQEEQLLLSWYHSFQQEADWDGDLLQDPERIGQLMWAKIIEGKMGRLSSGADRPVRKMLRWVAAASLLLLAGSAAYFLSLHKTNNLPIANKTEHSPADIAPGGHKAVLTLADGTVILLDSAANGAIAEQGNTSVIKQENGRVTYHSKGAAVGDPMMNTMRTPRGGQYQLTLPDGTKVWLNAASSITYPAMFTSRERKVTISGEAYFEVAKDQEKPFIVNVDGRSLVEVLGTHFNINAYTDETAIKTSLLDGAVKVDGHRLRPGQAYENGHIAPTNTDQDVAWKNGLFNFDKTPLEIVMRQLARWYDIQVVYQSPSPNIFVGGKMGRDLNLSQVMLILSDMQVKSRLEGRKLIIL